ncbi:squalene--hopene cyclase [Streptomyces sp. NPDC015345]|uniref:squalene--hopene cyclase n=1 Tax=Streptomyces sp. NPDC015345 TaxID=3364953 RepID=UPI0036F8DB39
MTTTMTAGDESQPSPAPASSTSASALRFPAASSGETDDAARRAVQKAAEHLLGLQRPDGHWRGFLEIDASANAHELLMRQFLGIRDERFTAAAGRWIRSQQRADGTWAAVHDGDGDLAITIESYVGLRLAGHGADEPHMLRSAEWIRAHGGIGAARVTTRIWLSLFGWWSWDKLFAVPPETILLPRWMPLNIYSYLYWARMTTVPYLAVLAHRPVAPAPFRLDELLTAEAPTRERSGKSPKPPTSPTGWEGALQGLDRVLRGYRRIRPAPLRRAAVNACIRWVVERQEADGSWGGVRVTTIWSLIALRTVGYRLDHPILKAGLDFLARTGHWHEDDVWMAEICQSPVWDTALSMIALADAGLPADHPALLDGADWLLAKQSSRLGDWAVQRPGLAPGGWSFQYENELYPDLDDTAEVVLALRRVRHPDRARVDEAVRRATHWTLGMQCRNGGWGAFDADGTSAFLDRLALTDITDISDPPTADITAHVVEMLAALELQADRRTRRGVRWLMDQQEEHGGWFGRWGINHVYGTGCAVPALTAAGVAADHPVVSGAVDWLTTVQNADGGWGEDWRSYADPQYVGRGPSTPSQTAWALLALLAAGERDSETVHAGVRWLLETQRDDGTWHEPGATGAAMRSHYALRYELYPLVFPLTALGRYVHHHGDEAASATSRP